MKPKLSICIPTYNRAQTLRETIDSILPQILGNPYIEILISDNASTDDTPSIVREYQLQNRSIISFTHTEKIRLRKIEAEEIEEAVCEGTIIEAYPDDSRGASCLILGFTNKGRSLHVVCGRLEEDEILIITAYEPDSKEWEADWKTRKEITYGG